MASKFMAAVCTECSVLFTHHPPWGDVEREEKYSTGGGENRTHNSANNCNKNFLHYSGFHVAPFTHAMSEHTPHTMSEHTSHTMSEHNRAQMHTGEETGGSVGRKPSNNSTNTSTNTHYQYMHVACYVHGNTVKI